MMSNGVAGACGGAHALPRVLYLSTDTRDVHMYLYAPSNIPSFFRCITAPFLLPPFPQYPPPLLSPPRYKRRFLAEKAKQEAADSQIANMEAEEMKLIEQLRKTQERQVRY